jgi:xanthine dehydrogenase iron-sulfur cluster and FAD-binding subunit A
MSTMSSTWQTFLRPTSLDEALDLLAQHADKARLVAGGTDVIVELSRGVLSTETLIDLTAIPDLKYIREEGERSEASPQWGTPPPRRSEEGDHTVLGALVTHNDVIASRACVEHALPLAQACWEVGAPQIRTRATVTGNLVTASPANDTIAPLMALDAELVIASRAGERVEPLRDFYRGVRKTTLQPGELVREIRVPKLRSNQRGLFLKLGLRRAQAISVINVAFVLSFDGEIVADARITLGSLAPTIVRARRAEDFLRGVRLDAEVCSEAGQLACQDVRPIDDLRGSARYRLSMLSSLVSEGLRRLADGTQTEGWPSRPILLDTTEVESPVETAMSDAPFSSVIETTINGERHSLPGAQGKTLLNMLREDAGLTGTKEGCAEGECGACTVWLNGQAVMACMVPAPQAHGATITTIEGLAASNGASKDELHPLQRTFVEAGAVQCGFCIPGMLMAGAKLLDEHPTPTLEDAQIALSGNICRCTGYRKILDAVLAAGGQR